MLEQSRPLYIPLIGHTKREQERKRAANEPMRLLVITQFFPPDYAPTGQLIDELTQQLSKQNIAIRVFSGQPGYAFESGQKVTPQEWRSQVRVKRSRTTQMWPQRIRGKMINGLLFFIRAGLEIVKCRHQYNIILLTTAPPFLQILGYLGSLFLNRPYVCLIYDLYPDIAISLSVISPQHWLARLWHKINHHVWNRAQGIIVLSPAMKQRIIRYCPEIESKTFVIHSWADPHLIVPIPKQDNWFAQKFNLTEKFTVMYSGNMGRCHDMETILGAMDHLREEPIQFVFIGGGAQLEELRNRVQLLKLSNCCFLPYQEKQVLPYSLTACDLSLISVKAGMQDLVAPSKLYSALSSGRPIAAICPHDSYLNELINDNAKCGATFENGDSQGLASFILYLNRDKNGDTATWMSRNGRHYLENNFTPEKISQSYREVLHLALDKHKSQFD